MFASVRLGTLKAIGPARRLSTSARCLANRAIVYRNTGDPKTVLTALTYPTLAPPPPQSLNVKFVLSPINPADVNVVEGVYPAKPTPLDSFTSGHTLNESVLVGGNEGLAEVTDVGEGVEGLKTGDWVVMGNQQLGTWSSARTLKAKDVVKVSSDVSEVTGATLTVNPPTAYNMLHDFAKLQPGDWVMQNGANSAVGQMVVQIAARRGFKTLNFVRNRDDLGSLKQQLTSLGATEVLTYDELEDKALRNRIKELTGGSPIRLLLNCVSGPATTQMLRHLGSNAHLVSYGAMSKQPLSLPTSAFIFKNLTCHGFWQSRWAKEHSVAEREELMNTLIDMKLKEPEHEIVTISAKESDEEATEKVREVMHKLSQGQHGKKVLLKLEQSDT